nr:uncharacterized protein LOC126054700 [Helicoverpa armigera]
MEPSNKTPTKRSMLSDISKLFDPLGWLSPLSTKLKLLFQQVWMSSSQWDDKLPDQISKEWLNIKDDMHKINQFKLERWLGTGENNTLELHGFCDSSNKAYACVVYCKTENNGVTKISLVAGKARLAPVNKSISLPKLELSGALLLSKLLAKIKQCFISHNIKIYTWTDSMVVLAWLQKEPGRWKPFVANRVRQISSIIPIDCWRYVKSAENPADCASRGLSIDQLKNHSLWWEGPSWLRKYDPDHETEQAVFTTDEEARKAKKLINHISQQESDNILDELLVRYSTLAKLTRVLAWILRFIKQARYKKNRMQTYLTLHELKNAKHKIILHVQQREFAQEVHYLKENKPLSAKNKLLQLNPFLDNEGLLRVKGRLSKANINQDMMHPIIIAHEGHLTNLIIDQAHELTFHGGARVTSAFIRKNYWIIGGNRAVKKRIRTCVTCRKHNPSKMTQLMGDLPTQRCNIAKPFEHTGVDFTGHVLIKANKGRGIKTTKGYVVVFVCMATKLVHLDLVSDLTSSAFLAALRRMAGRKGSPKHLYSDNAGGLWEAAVKSLKYHLRRVVGEQKLTFEEFSTVLAQLEAVLNSRPLCPLTEDPNDLDFLSPSSFINLNQDMTILETETDMRTRWHLTQKIVQDIWKRWHAEYLTQLSARSKWRHSQPDIQLNDIVTINDANLPPGKWAVGRVVQLHPGADGHIRVVTLKTKNGLIKRPIIKLSILPVNDRINKQELRSKEVKDGKPYQIKRVNYSFFSLVMLLLSFMSILTTAYGSYNVTQLKDNQGFYLDKIANMQLIRDEWKIVTYYDMNSLWQGTEACSKYLGYLEQLCNKFKETSHCDVIQVQLKHEFSELEYYNHLLLSQHTGTRRARDLRRRKRGLINGVGLHGTASAAQQADRFSRGGKGRIGKSTGNATRDPGTGRGWGLSVIIHCGI